MNFMAEVGGERPASREHRVGKGLEGGVGQLNFGGRSRDQDTLGRGKRRDDERPEPEYAGALDQLAARKHLGEPAEVLLLAKLLQNASLSLPARPLSGRRE